MVLILLYQQCSKFMLEFYAIHNGVLNSQTRSAVWIEGCAPEILPPPSVLLANNCAAKLSA